MNCRQFVKKILENFYAVFMGMGIFMIWKELRLFATAHSSAATPLQPIHHTAASLTAPVDRLASPRGKLDCAIPIPRFFIRQLTQPVVL